MTVDPNIVFMKASDYWCAGNALEAGRQIYEIIPKYKRPMWAARILNYALQVWGNRPPIIVMLIDITHISSDWVKGKELFSALREQTLGLEKRNNRTNEQHILLRLLYVAENVAKVIYNASDPDNAFDEDSGWWVVACLSDYLKSFNDPEHSRSAWHAITSPDVF